MDFKESPEQHVPRTYQDLVQVEMDSRPAITEAEARDKVELAFFEERISQFTKGDLVQDDGGGWKGFEQKVRDVFPELPEDRFRAMKAAVTMHLCGQ